MEPKELTEFLAAMASKDVTVRQVAASKARQMGPSALPKLADLTVSDDPAIAKAARQAMADITHQSARPGGPANERKATADTLLKLALEGPAPPQMARAHFLHLLGYVGGGNHAKTIKPLEADPEVGEDARMAGERIRRA